MAAVGSAGTSRSAFQQVLKFENHEELSLNSSRLLARLVQDKSVVTLIANKIYQGLPKLNKDYENIMKKHYGPAVEQSDFPANPEGERQKINEWVFIETKGIKNLLPAGSICDLTRMVLVNAIFFKGNWEKKFDEKDTVKESFNLSYSSKGTAIKVSMMHITEEFKHIEAGGIIYVSLPYAGGEYEMEIIVPENIEKYEKYFQLKDITFLRNNAFSSKIRLSLPKFKVGGDDSTPLKDVLSSMGLGVCFSNGADFSAMDPNNSIILSNVYHQAVVEINEKGTEAKAATAVTMKLRCRQEEVTIDKPFIYTIVHKPTNSLLFLGRIADPSKN